MPRRKKPDEDPNANPPSDGQQEVATLPEPSANGTHETQAPEPVTNRPCKSFSCAISAGVYAEASIWPKSLQLDGRELVVYSVTVRKNYKTDDGWRNTQFFRGSELFIIRHLMESAEKWILAARTDEDPPF